MKMREVIKQTKNRNKISNKIPNKISNNESYFKQIFIQMPNIYKKLKKIQDKKVKEYSYNSLIHSYGLIDVKNDELYNNHNIIPSKSYKNVLNFENTEIPIFINEYNDYNKVTRDITHIPFDSEKIKTKIVEYKLNDKSKITLVLEYIIKFNDEVHSYDLDFDDCDNNVIKSYYFKIFNDSENSHFIKEDIFSFYNHLN